MSEQIPILDIMLSDEFIAVLQECLNNHELVTQYNRLTGSTLKQADTRPPIVKMIDESTGYDKVIDEKTGKQTADFALFVFELIYIPWLNDMYKDTAHASV